jgi:DNA-directed RNA polymerase subunit RPC12/RpoP
MKKSIGHTNTCSCGKQYREWKKDNAHCQSCTSKMLRQEVMQYKQNVERLCLQLTEKHSGKLQRMPFYQQRIVIDKVWQEGDIDNLGKEALSVIVETIDALP